MDDPKHTKTITGYCEPLSLRAGETIRCMASSHTPGPARLDLVRIICGDPTRSGPGFKEREVPSELPPQVTLTEQCLQPGSYGEVDLSGFSVTRQIKFTVHVLATQPDQDQTLFSVVGESGPLLVLRLSNRRLVTHIGKTELTPPRAASPGQALVPSRNPSGSAGRHCHGNTHPAAKSFTRPGRL